MFGCLCLLVAGVVLCFASYLIGVCLVLCVLVVVWFVVVCLCAYLLVFVCLLCVVC